MCGTGQGQRDKQEGDRAEAIRKLELATKVAPDEPLGWTNLGQTYVEVGDFANATRVMETAVKLRDSTAVRAGLYQAAIMSGNIALAEQQVEAVRGRRDEVDMVVARMFGATYRGRMKEAATLAGDYQARMVALSRGPQAGQVLITVAVSEALAGLQEQAAALAEAAKDAGVVDDSALDERLVLASVIHDAVEARAVLTALQENPKTPADGTAQAANRERALRALVLMAEKKPVEALALLEPVTFASQYTDVVQIWTLARLEAGHLEDAAKGLAFINSKDARTFLTAFSAFAYANLARVQAQLGQKDEARRTYEKFFDLWKDADPDVPLLVRAREEYSKLGS